MEKEPEANQDRDIIREGCLICDDDWTSVRYRWIDGVYGAVCKCSGCGQEWFQEVDPPEDDG